MYEGRRLWGRPPRPPEAVLLLGRLLPLGSGVAVAATVALGGSEEREDAAGGTRGGPPPRAVGICGLGRLLSVRRLLPPRGISGRGRPQPQPQGTAPEVRPAPPVPARRCSRSLGQGLLLRRDRWRGRRGRGLPGLPQVLPRPVRTAVPALEGVRRRPSRQGRRRIGGGGPPLRVRRPGRAPGRLPLGARGVLRRADRLRPRRRGQNRRGGWPGGIAGACRELYLRCLRCAWLFLRKKPGRCF